jgi:predicted nucleic acid-binding Zn ribbon protein
MIGKKKKKAGSLKGLLPDLVRERGWEKQLDLYSIFPRWRELVGPEIYEYARPLKIVRGVLWIEVENSAWLQQMQFEKLQLLDLLNQALRLNRLNDIKMVLPAGGKSEEKKPARSVTFVRPDTKEIEAFERQVSCIGDEKCRDALMQFWYLSRACRIIENK